MAAEKNRKETPNDRMRELIDLDSDNDEVWVSIGL